MVVRHEESILFGNSVEPDGLTLTYTRAEWKEFVFSVNHGDSDGLF